MKPVAATQCYCNVPVKEPSMILCNKCRRLFHAGCLRTGKPSPLEGDIFFSLICEPCSSGDGEKITRQQIQWLQVVSLTLYNLSHSTSGKNGYFRWKEHICAFIDKHWHIFFGSNRKKTHTWHGTVAGTLSQGCPSYFTSGTTTLRESGWWKLTDNKPPALETLSLQKSNKRYRAEKEPLPLKVGGLRSRKKKTSIQAAIELKAKRDTLQEAKEIRGAQQKTSKSMQAPPPPVLLPLTKKSLEAFADGAAHLSNREDIRSPDTSLSEPPSCSTSRLGNHSFELASDLTDQSSQMSFSSTRSEMWFTDRDLVPGRDVPSLLLKEDEDEEEFEIDPCALSPASTHSHDQVSGMMDSLPNVEDILSHFGENDEGSSSQKHENEDISFRPFMTKIKQEPLFETNNMPPSEASDFESVQVKQENDSLLSGSMGTEYEDSLMEGSISITKDLSLTATPTGIKCAESLVAETVQVKEEPVSSSESDDESRSEQDTRIRLAVPSNPVRDGWKKLWMTPQELNPGERLFLSTVYEERILICKLKSKSTAARSRLAAARRLKRKLIVRQEKRERGLPVFDFDARISQIIGSKRDLYGMTDVTKEQQQSIDRLNPNSLPVSREPLSSTCILDRYHQHGYNIQQPRGVSFLTRLVGTEDDQLKPIRSPYTSRLLKPFIRRDYETAPRKLKLLREIKARGEKSQPEPPTSSAQETAAAAAACSPRSPIDYCYVRPQHIPSVNALCQQFFWPGIDVSECLQYPDFSCVVLYRKLVIGFAFMVPDVKYNEAYISFIFTHPEWRGAGIAQFMLYHLIQSCMGKDVTLHVSATNTAMLLYQKFGFKPEEFILDFYDKYFPPESRDSRHAFFLRLRR